MSYKFIECWESRRGFKIHYSAPDDFAYITADISFGDNDWINVHLSLMKCHHAKHVMFVDRTYAGQIGRKDIKFKIRAMTLALQIAEGILSGRVESKLRKGAELSSRRRARKPKPRGIGDLMMKVTKV